MRSWFIVIEGNNLAYKVRGVYGLGKSYRSGQIHPIKFKKLSWIG
jgi:hypothetical protein